MNNKYYSIIGIVIFVLLIFIFLVVFYFEETKSDKIVDTVINNSHIQIPQENRKVLSESAKLNIKKARNLLSNYPSLLKDRTNDLILKSLPENVNIPIQECDKCPQQENILNTMPEFPEIALPEDMPWDEKIDYCKNAKGTIYDIDMYDTLIDYKPKIIMH